jgi:tRNA 2-thiouridine synthesizing protein E
MPAIEFKEKLLAVDEEGFLKRYNDWCPEWEEYVRVAQGIDALNEDHWKRINVPRSYYKVNGMPRMVRILPKATGFKMKHIIELFPEGPGKGACEIAGLPKPKGCFFPSGTDTPEIGTFRQSTGTGLIRTDIRSLIQHDTLILQ